jgi:hypothetical protein
MHSLLLDSNVSDNEIPGSNQIRLAMIYLLLLIMLSSILNLVCDLRSGKRSVGILAIFRFMDGTLSFRVAQVEGAQCDTRVVLERGVWLKKVQPPGQSEDRALLSREDGRDSFTTITCCAQSSSGSGLSLQRR